MLFYCDPNSYKGQLSSDGASEDSSGVWAEAKGMQGKLALCKISIHDNLADMMTKPVTKFEICANMVGITV